jgi:HEAT repeat protein
MERRKVESMFSSGKTRCLLVISFIWGAILVGCGEQESPVTEQDTAGSSQQSASPAGSASDGAATATESDSASAEVAAKDTDASSSTKDPHHSVRQWLTQLVAEEAAARDQAREQLKSTGVEDELLLTLMKDSSETVRQGAAYYLTGRFAIQDIALQQAFLEALEDENSKVRQLALQMVARMPVKTIRPAIPQLVSMLDASAEDERNRATVARFLGRLKIEWQQVLPALIESVKQDPAGAVRKASLYGVSRIALPKEAVPVYRHVLSQDKELSVRRTAAVQLGRLGQAAAAACTELGAAMAEEDDQLSDTAAAALTRIGAKAVPELIRQVSSSVPRARRLAIYSLGVLGPPAKPAIPTLRLCLKDEDAEVRQLAEMALRKLLFLP